MSERRRNIWGREVSCLMVGTRARTAWLGAAGLALCACAHGRTHPEPSPALDPAPEAAPPSASVESPDESLERGRAALERGEAARAVALLSRVVASGREDLLLEGFRGLADAHEQLGDCPAAIRAWEQVLAHQSDPGVAAAAYARRGACEAEIERWEASAMSYAAAVEVGGEGLLASSRVEALARRGYALYHLGRDEDADAVLADADAVYEEAMEGDEERFATFYFVGMARFYRAAVLHRQFRESPIRMPEARMAEDFERKLELLTQAQERYNDTIRAKHVYWVSAAGYQLGSLFAEFYDDLMYAPVPEWLDERQRRIYYEELKTQLRPVVDKAIWVYEKNLETAEKLGYDNAFVERTQDALGRLQGVLLARDATLGRPHPRMAGEQAAQGGPDPDQGQPADERPAVERKLFVPTPTPM